MAPMTSRVVPWITWGLYPSSLILFSTSFFSLFSAPDFMTMITFRSFPDSTREGRRVSPRPSVFMVMKNKKPGAFTSALGFRFVNLVQLP